MSMCVGVNLCVHMRGCEVVCMCVFSLFVALVQFYYI